MCKIQFIADFVISSRCKFERKYMRKMCGTWLKCSQKGANDTHTQTTTEIHILCELQPISPLMITKNGQCNGCWLYHSFSLCNSWTRKITCALCACVCVCGFLKSTITTTIWWRRRRQQQCTICSFSFTCKCINTHICNEE